MTVNMTLRLPTELAALADQAASDAGQSRHAWIIASLTAAVQRGEGDLDPNLCIGYVELLGGEINPRDTDCPVCGCAMERPHIGFLYGVTRPIPMDPVCIVCAS